MCYGAPFIIALAYVFVDSKGRGRIYGPATVGKPFVRLDVIVLTLGISYGAGYQMNGSFFG